MKLLLQLKNPNKASTGSIWNRGVRIHFCNVWKSYTAAFRVWSSQRLL